jgi:outer membrane protein assembly factor BamE
MYPAPDFLRKLVAICLLVAVTACVYEVDVQQGNKLEPHDVEAVQVGMTRSQVRYLLGTPVVNNLFRDDRWHYVYYHKPGRKKQIERRWLIVWFDGDTVSQIERDALDQSDDEAEQQDTA